MEKDKSIGEVNKRHLKYFSGKDFRLVGLIMMVASGVLFLWNWYVWYFFVLYIFMIILFPAGLAMFIIGSVGRSTDEDIDRLITRLSSEADIDTEKDTELARRQLKRPLPQIVSGYDYSDGLMFKKGKNNVVRSEIFKKATLFPTEEGIYVSYAIVNIPCETVKKEIFEISFSEIEDIRVVSERKVIRFLKKSFSVNDSRLEIISHGEIVLSLPAKESATLDSFIQEIKAHNA